MDSKKWNYPKHIVRLKIFNNILFGSLRPWKQSSHNEKDYANFIKTSGFVQQNNSMNEFKSAIQSIFPKTDLLTDEDFDIYSLNDSDNQTNIVAPLIDVELPQPQNAKCRFYYYLIFNEVTRLSDLLLKFITGPETSSNKTYLINNTVEAIKYHIKEATTQLENDAENSDTKYILSVLRLSLVRFLFEVEHLYADYVKTPQTTDNELYFELLKEQQPSEGIYKVNPALHQILDKISVPATEENITPPPTSRVSFNFNGNKANLLTVIQQLNNQIELLNEDVTSPQQMVDVLTARNLDASLPKIRFNTETKQVRYVIDKLDSSFSNLTLTLIANCGLFLSKKGTPLTYSNLSSSKHHNPKNKETIDSIFRSL